MNNNEVVALTKEQALSCLQVKNGRVHSFIMAPFGLMGADIDLADVTDIMDHVAEPGHIQIAGAGAQSLHHAITVYDARRNDWLFLESDTEKVATMEASVMQE